ncbi:MAG: glutamine amidotransferase [Clostridiales bacterium]|uniref:type 1 glutamine amidotransferase family protein n=1 Tax=Roseburia sp. MSJ-14 TaxID=2841514 RepID=UPI00169C45C7|nr:type 1 glutamine amidotransferase family protein [Roseburia sp. MSJ-14]MBU5473709.1 glutamine amidotransferase [Roseburia sp. MSJ-14]NLK77378.1 glutamine amidotransferase [Clostridiales bacterium]
MKEVLVFIFDGFADWEPAYICAELNAPGTGYTVKTISFDKKAKVSMGGFHVIPDYAINDYPSDFSLLILTGGTAWIEQKNNGILPVVDYAISKHIPVGAICNAVNFMAENGYLDKIKHSGNTLEFMKAQAPHYKGDDNFLEVQAVCDSNIITANGSATLEFAKKIMELLDVKSEQARLEWYQLNKSGFYPM